MALKGEAELDEFIETQLEQIHQQIEAIDNHKIVRAAQALLAKKSRLQAAERALLGAGSKTTSSGGDRVTQAQVVAAMTVGEVHTVDELAAAMGVSPEVVRGHLNRGRGERFVAIERGHWGLRDPEAGYSSADDFAMRGEADE
jgi:hypothetical protein